MNFEQYSKKELLDLLQEKSLIIDTLTKELEASKIEIELLKSKLFGSSSEKSSTLPGDHLLDEASLSNEQETIDIEEADEEIYVQAYVRSKSKNTGKRKPLPDYLPIIEKIYELPEDERLCDCGCMLRHIKDEISEQLEIIPAQMYIIRHIRRKYGNCENKCDLIIRIANMPQQPLPKSIAAPGLISHVITAKYEDHLPLYRQEQILQRLGIDILRQTLCLWVLKGSELLLPLYELIQHNICTNEISFADETTLQVIKEKDKKAQTKSYMWVIAGGTEEKFCYYYKYSSSRSHEVLFDLLPNFSGFLHCDGYSGYDAFCNKQRSSGLNIIQVGCWYHARRKFVEVAKASKNKGIATWVIDRIGKLSTIEEAIKELSIDEKFTLRQKESLPILNEIKAKLDATQSTIPEKSKLGEAVQYTLNQWHKLVNYITDGRLEISNNKMERQMKPFATGRKNWLFSFSTKGADCSAIYFSFQATCKHHNINFYLWLKYVFRVIREYPKDNIADLLPYNIDPSLLEAEGKIPVLKFRKDGSEIIDTN